MITTGDYTLRPLTADDQRFMYETMKDFPVQTMTYTAVINAMSYMLHVGDYFTEEGVTGDVSICMVLEHQGTPVSFRFNKFENNVCDVVLAATHPQHRGQGHFSAQAYMFGIWYFNHLQIDECYLELVDTTDVTATAEAWRQVTQRDEEVRLSRNGAHKLSKLVIRPEDFNARVTNHPTYGNSEFTVGGAVYRPEDVRLN